MLEDTIKTKMVQGKSVRLLLYSIEECDRDNEDDFKEFYEIRISHNDEQDNFEIYAENYLKKEALLLFDEACVEAKKQHKAEQEKIERKRQDELPIDVAEKVTGKVFTFKDSYDKREFFRAWKRLVVEVK